MGVTLKIFRKGFLVLFHIAKRGAQGILTRNVTGEIKEIFYFMFMKNHVQFTDDVSVYKKTG